MKKKTRLMAGAVLLSSCVLFTSCFGSFSLTQKLYGWNKSMGDKWINEVVFFALAVVQVYTISLIADGIVLNTIEFWTGDNPASASVQTIETENGNYTVTTDANGHKIEMEGSDEIVEFRFDQEENSWSLLTMDEEIPLFKMVDDAHAMVYLADGNTMTITADQAGAYALRQAVENKAYFASK